MSDHNSFALADLLQPKLARYAAAHDADQVATVLRWLEALNDEDPVCALEATERLEFLLDRLSADGFGRWILAGVRRHAADMALRRKWFRLDDTQAVAALHSEASAEPLQRALTSLGLLVAGLTSNGLRVQAREQTQLNAPRMRPVLTSTHLLLPDDYTALDGGGDRQRLYRAAVAHAAAHLRHSVPGRPANMLKPMGIAVVSAIEDARVERLFLRDFPGVRRWFLDSLGAPPDPNDLGFAALLSRMDRALLDPDYQDDNYWVDKARRLFDETVARSGLADYDAFRAVASILANDLGQMRVRFNPQQYVVPAPYRDDNSYLWHFEDSSVPPEDEMALQQISVRLPPDAGESQDSDVPQGGVEMEIDRFSYPEWDQRLERLRPDWCTVIEKTPAWQGFVPSRGSDAGGGAEPPLVLPRARRFSRKRRLRRQWEGEDVDLDAAIEVLIDRRMRLHSEPRLFMRPGRSLSVSSILVLLDLSESTNDRADEASPSLLETEKQAALLLAGSTVRDGDRIAIHGFSSNTRAEVYYYRLLEFGAMPTPVSRGMIASVQARYSTRMGAALRHAAAQLAQEASSQRAILLISDGAPSDIDVHEPNYLTEDARAAVLDARRAGVHTYCIAVDAAADDYVRRIFGWRNYCIVEDPRSLPAQLQRAYARLAAI